MTPGAPEQPPVEPPPAARPTLGGHGRLADRIHTWPYLVRLEMIAALIILVITTVWSIGIDAPLEQPADPSKTPNPSKAPWYFLGLQELLVYFDPWIAGVLMPILIIVGLMVIPYIDTNPKGNGYYTVRERPFAIGTFLFGFVVLWVILILIGTFMRGPGWYFFWPGQYWDPHKTVALANVDLPYLLGARSYWAQFAVGGVATALLLLWWIPLIPLLRRRGSRFYASLGALRFSVAMSLLAIMLALPIKMILRWTLNVKYLWVTPWFNV